MNSCVVTRLDGVKPSEVSWLWPGRIPLAKVTMLAGDPGLGKSFLTTWLAARTTRADDFPDCTARLRGPADVVFLSAEDDPRDTILPRCLAHGADPARIHVVEGIRAGGNRKELTRGLSLDRDIEALEALLESLPRPRLVVIDPISAYLGDVDGNSNTAVRGVLRDLSELARRYGPAIVCITHLNKGGAGQKAIYRAMGSLAFIAAARVAYYVRKHPEDEMLRCVALAKANLPVRDETMLFRLRDGGVAWESMNAGVSADQLDRAEESGDVSASTDAREFLSALLRDGPVEARRVLESGASAGLSESTLRRVKQAMGVVSTQSGDRWSWSLAQGARPQAVRLSTDTRDSLTACDAGARERPAGPQGPGAPADPPTVCHNTPPAMIFGGAA